MEKSAKNIINQFTEQEILYVWPISLKRFSSSLGITVMQIIPFHTHQTGDDRKDEKTICWQRGGDPTLLHSQWGINTIIQECYFGKSNSWNVHKHLKFYLQCSRKMLFHKFMESTIRMFILTFFVVVKLVSKLNINLMKAYAEVYLHNGIVYSS